MMVIEPKHVGAVLM